MKALARMPAIPAPPHDPTSTLLAGWLDGEPRLGFRGRVFERVEVQAACKSLVLAPAPDAARLLTEASGSFGGNRPPLNVATSNDGAVFVLDPVSGRLSRFDAFECRFVEVPCFTRVVSCANTAKHRYVPRDQLCEPHGIAICGDELLVADSGHSRLLRYSLDGFIARGVMALPPAETAARVRAWYPFAIAVDAHGTRFVSDPHNQRIDVFNARGRWLKSWKTAESAWALAVDVQGRLLAVLANVDGLEPGSGERARWNWVTSGPPAQPRVVRFVDGTALAVPADEAIRWPDAGVDVDGDGFLHLPCVRSTGDFDARGRALPGQQRALRERFQRAGRFETRALDSQIEGCQWHRIELRGKVPPGCRVAVRTLCAQVELDADEIDGLPDSCWSEAIVARGAETPWPGDRWDCLVTSAPGRFLWLRLEFAGDGHDTPLICAAVVEFPRISLRRYLPAVFGADANGADFTDRFTAVFDTTLRSIERKLDRMAEMLDPLSAPSGRDGEPDFLSWIASWIGVTLIRDWPEARQRHFVKDAARLYARRGTVDGLRGQLQLLLGFDTRLERCADERPRRRCCPVPLNCGSPPERKPACAPPLLLEHFRLRRWLFAGSGRLGDDSVLWGRSIVNRSQLSGAEKGKQRSGNAQLGVTRIDTVPDPQRDPLLVHAHRFSVFVPARIRASDAERRAFELLLARETPAHTACEVHYVEPRFRVGQQAMIGLDSVIARTPSGVVLDDNRLGQGSVLSAPRGRRAAPLRVGNARVGTTTIT
jgi:phage tail-like protein